MAFLTAMYTTRAVANLYFRRWEVETHLRELKQTMRMDVLKCKTVDGITKELTVYALVYNLVRVVMQEAARRQGVAVERISFVDALRWLSTATPGEPFPDLMVNPLRLYRAEPRSIKRRPKQYPWMSSPRAVMRKRLANQGLPA
jgi:Transposase DDE domain